MNGKLFSDWIHTPPPLVKRQVDILELKDLEKEYNLARSRLTLAQHHPPSAGIAGTSQSVCVCVCVSVSVCALSFVIFRRLFVPTSKRPSS